MEAFKLTYITSDSTGQKKAVTNKTWAVTGWEAAEKGRIYLLSRGYQNVVFLKWRVLSPGMSHF